MTDKNKTKDQPSPKNQQQEKFRPQPDPSKNINKTNIPPTTKEPHQRPDSIGNDENMPQDNGKHSG